MRNVVAKKLLLPLALLAPIGCDAADEGREEPVTSQVSEALFDFPWVIAAGTYPFEVVAVHSNKCLEIQGGPTLGNRLQQSACNAGQNQAWRMDGWFPAGGIGQNPDTFSPKNFYSENEPAYFASWQLRDNSAANYNPLIFEYWFEGSGRNGFDFIQKPDNSFEIRTQFSTWLAPRCVDVHQMSTANGAAVQQFSCTNGSNQRFKVRPQRVQATIQRFGSQLCVDVAGASTANYANVQQLGCNDPVTTNQRFYLKDIDWSSGGPYFSIEAAHSGKCLDVAGASAADGANVQQYSCTGGVNQKWAIDVYDYYPNPGFYDPTIRLRNKNSGKCLDIEDAAWSDGTNIRQYTCQTVSNGYPVQSQWFQFLVDGRPSAEEP